MAVITPAASKKLDDLLERLKKAIEATASTFATDEDSSECTDGHIREAYKTLVRGNARPRWGRILLGLCEYMSALLSATGFLILSFRPPNQIAPDWMAAIVIAAGAAIFVLLKQA